MKRSNQQYKGFTLIELLIVMCIIGILVALAVPSYRRYVRRAHYAEIVSAAYPFKLGVHECYGINGDLSECHNGKNGMPLDMTETADESLIATITTTGSGVIQITPKNRYGITDEDVFIMTPTESHHQLIWHTSGQGVVNGYAD